MALDDKTGLWTVVTLHPPNLPDIDAIHILYVHPRSLKNKVENGVWAVLFLHHEKY